jgi:thiol-disulfide isomerase/thioredoxin
LLESTGRTNEYFERYRAMGQKLRRESTRWGSAVLIAVVSFGLTGCDRGGEETKQEVRERGSAASDGDSGDDREQSDGDRESATGPAEPGSPVPDLEVETLDGETVELEASGEATLVNLWATWCAPCIAELPEFEKLESSWGSKGLRLVGLSIESSDARDKIEKFVDERDPPFEVRFAPGRDPLRAFRAGSVPATFLYDADGELVWSHGSMIEKKERKNLEGHLEDLLGSGAN